MKFYFLYLWAIVISALGICQKPAYISTVKAAEDIEYIVNTIEAVHYSPYFKTNKKDFYQHKNMLVSQFDTDSIRLRDFIAVGMTLVAKMSGGHTAMNWQNPKMVPELKNYYYLPFTGKLTDDNTQFIVTRSVHPDLRTGMVVNSINNIDMVKLYNQCLAYEGGIFSFKNVNCEKLLPIYLFFTNQIPPPYVVKINEGQVEIRSSGLEVEEMLLFLNDRQVKDNYTFKIINDNIGLLTYNRCVDYSAFKKFLKQAFKTLKTKQINKLIVDIRENGGGDSSLNDLLLSYITTAPYRQSSGRYWKVSELSKLAYSSSPVYAQMFGKDFMTRYQASDNQSIIEDFYTDLTTPVKPNYYFSGKTCFLIGPNTFSSANFLADAIKTYELSTLIGMSTGEYTNDFGELLKFTLPNAGNDIYVSSTYDIGANADSTIFEPVHPNLKVDGDVLSFAIDWIQK